MHTRHCPRHVLAAPPAHFSGIYVTAPAGVLHRRWVERAGGTRGTEDERVSPWGSRGMRKRRARGTEIMLRDFWVRGWGGASRGEELKRGTMGEPPLPTNETSPSKTTLASLPFRHPSSLSRSLHRPTPCIHLSYRFTRDLGTGDGYLRSKKKGER